MNRKQQLALETLMSQVRAYIDKYGSDTLIASIENEEKQRIQNQKNHESLSEKARDWIYPPGF